MAYTTIDDPSAHFQTTLYSGTGSTASVTNGGNSDLQPDLVWIKCRNVVRDHRLLDSTRGVQKELVSNSASAEYTESTGLTAFQSDGFQHGGANGYGASGENYVSWQWKANGGTRVTFSESGDNPAGGRQVNATAGFSLIDYTGTGGAGTIAHGLGAVPHAIFCHDRGGNNHAVYNRGLASDAETDYLRLDTTGASVDDSGRWNDTAPTSTVFTLGSNNEVNGDDRTYVAWVFTSIQGYSRAGSYEGNGNADGPSVFLGFRPAFLMIKGYAGTDDWIMLDHKRSGYNSENEHLDANNTSVESDGSGNIDFLANGFKIKSSFSSLNFHSGEYAYIAFAEFPFVSSKGVPCTAR